jgi:hypothetical protein
VNKDGTIVGYFNTADPESIKELREKIKIALSK